MDLRAHLRIDDSRPTADDTTAPRLLESRLDRSARAFAAQCAQIPTDVDGPRLVVVVPWGDAFACVNDDPAVNEIAQHDQRVDNVVSQVLDFVDHEPIGRCKDVESGAQLRSAGDQSPPGGRLVEDAVADRIEGGALAFDVLQICRDPH